MRHDVVRKTPGTCQWMRAALNEAMSIEMLGNPQDILPRQLTSSLRRRGETALHDQNATFLEVVDPATNGHMAWATWGYYPALSNGEANSTVAFEWPLPQWCSLLQKCSDEVMTGQPHDPGCFKIC